MQIPERIKAEYSKLLAAPRWKRNTLLAVVAMAAVYLLWCRFGPQPIKPGQTVAAVTAPKIATMAREEITPRRVVVFKDKAEAVKRLNLPKEQAANPQEKLLDATVAPASRYGTTTAVFLNTSTGKPRSTVTANKAPWFAFERGNEIGGEIGVGNRGRYIQGDYQRDLASVKGAIIGIKLGATSYLTETDWQTGVRLKYRW